MSRAGKIALSSGIALIALGAIWIITQYIRLSPTHNDAKLKAISAEAHALMTLGASSGWQDVPKSRWPATIASLDPRWVQVFRWGVEVQIEGFFDGGWGYDIVPNGGKPPMPIECYQNLGRGIYWHDPC